MSKDDALREAVEKCCDEDGRAYSFKEDPAAWTALRLAASQDPEVRRLVVNDPKVQAAVLRAANDKDANFIGWCRDCEKETDPTELCSNCDGPVAWWTAALFEVAAAVLAGTVTLTITEGE